MVTASVIAGNSEVGEMVLTPSPGMSNLIVSAPSKRLVEAIASPKVQSVRLQPPPGSSSGLGYKHQAQGHERRHYNAQGTILAAYRSLLAQLDHLLVLLRRW
jgi:hypothetical protein